MSALIFSAGWSTLTSCSAEHAYRIMYKPRIMVSLVCLALLTSCGGGNGSTPNLSGNWQLTLVNTQTHASKSESGFLVQSGTAVTGNVLLTGQTNCAGTGSAQGQVSGSSINITVNQVGQTFGLTGTIASSGSKMSGNYTLLASPCGNSQVGTWSASLVSALTGNLKATFTSTTTPGLVYQFAGMITQGANAGGTSATLSGSMQSTNAPCLTSVVITGQISGTAVVFNLLSTEGVAIGQYVGTATTDGGTVTGTYNLQPEAPSQSGCHDFGNAVFDVQAGGST